LADERPPRSFSLTYWILLGVAVAGLCVGGWLCWKRHDYTVSAISAVALMLVLTTWPIARTLYRLRMDLRKDLSDKLTPCNDTLDQMSVLLNLISEQQLLTERAKSVAFREKERDTLRRAIQEEIAKQDWEAALALANEIENSFGYKSEADRFRTEISHRRSDLVRRMINDAVAGIDRHMRGENWGAATREAERLMQLYPTDDQVQRLPHDIEARRQQHKKQLVDSFNESFDRKDWEGAIEILKRLDLYLTPSEAETIQDKARVVFKEKLNNLRTQFHVAVQDENWREAHRIADEVIREYPNTQMAREMRDVIDTLKQRADGIAPEQVAGV
jgi:hypothetical protein